MKRYKNNMIKSYIAFDLETTGLNVETDEIIEIGALKVKDGKVVERFMEFLKPETPISPMITSITGITNEMVADARDRKTILHEFVDFCDDEILIGHNIQFDYKFCKKFASKYQLPFEKKGIDTLKIARKVHKDLESKSLGALCEYYQIENKAAHRAYHDALATAKLYQTLAHYYEEKEPNVFKPEQLVYRPKKIQPMTEKQKQFLISLCEQHNIRMELKFTTMTRNEASKQIDRILSEYGTIKREWKK